MESTTVKYGNTKKFEMSGMYENTEISGYAEIRYNDHCGNGHNDFSITGNWWHIGKVRSDRNMFSGGCTHDIILELSKNTENAEFFKNAVKFHLVSSEAPMHYFANTMYHASDKDCYGYRKGEPNSWGKKLKINGYPFSIKMSKELREFLENDSIDKSNLKIIPIAHKKDSYDFSDNYCFESMNISEWHKCPFGTIREAQEYKDCIENNDWYIEKVITGYSKGKERNLKAAQSCAIWENATIEQLESKEQLEVHLKEVMQEFYNFITIDCKFEY